MSDRARARWRAAPASAGSTCCSSPTLVDVRWLTGFTGSNALAVLGLRGDGRGALPDRLPLRLRRSPSRCPASGASRRPRRSCSAGGSASNFERAWAGPARRGRLRRRGADREGARRGLPSALGDRAELVAAGGLGRGAARGQGRRRGGAHPRGRAARRRGAARGPRPRPRGAHRGARSPSTSRSRCAAAARRR